MRFFYQITYTLGDKHPTDVGRLHVLFRRENPTSERRTLNSCLAEEKGRYVGAVIGIRNLHPKEWWGEGEFKVYMDGDTEFPTICGTGSEDYVGLWLGRSTDAISLQWLQPDAEEFRLDVSLASGRSHCMEEGS